MGDFKVDISSLYNIDLAKLQNLPEDEIAWRFDGTDLSYNKETKKLERKAAGGVATESLAEQTARIQNILKANINGETGDRFLDEEEMAAALKNENSAADPVQYLKNIEKLIKVRYEILARTMSSTGAQIDFEFFGQMLRSYSEGIRDNDILQGTQTWRYNAAHKAALNGVTSPYAGYRIITDKTNEVGEPASGVPQWLFDKMAKDSAEERFKEREGAIQALAKVFSEGAKKGEDWALEMDIPVALTKVEEKYQKLLKEHLAIEPLFKILSEPDDAERAKLLLEFAKNELSGFIGIGGGNTSPSNFWNYTGKHNNIEFARGVLRAIYTKIPLHKPVGKDGKLTPEQLAFNEKMGPIRKEAKALYDSIRGDGLAGWNNLTQGAFQRVAFPIFHYGSYVTTKPIGKIFGKDWEFNGTPVAFRAWSEEEKIGGFGQGMFLALCLYGSYKAIQGVKDVSHLAPFGRAYGTGIRSWGSATLKAWREGRGFAAVFNRWKIGGGHWYNQSRWWNLWTFGMGHGARVAEVEALGGKLIQFEVAGVKLNGVKALGKEYVDVMLKSGKEVRIEAAGNAFYEFEVGGKKFLQFETSMEKIARLELQGDKIVRYELVSGKVGEILDGERKIMGAEVTANTLSEAEIAGKRLNAFGKGKKWVADKTIEKAKKVAMAGFKKLPAGTQEGLSTAGSVTGKGMTFTTDAVISLGLSQYAMDKTEPTYNVYDLNYEMKPNALRSRVKKSGTPAPSGSASAPPASSK